VICQLLLSQLLALGVAAPSIDSVVPSPLPRAATAEVLGSELSGATLMIAAIPQQVLFAEPLRVRFMVAAETPLGAQTLVVTTAMGVAQVAVEVVAPSPLVTVVNPPDLVLGGRATLQGMALGAVTAVSLDGVPCVVSEQTDVVIAFEVPFDPGLLGQAALRLDSPSGPAQRTVNVLAPLPVVDALVPNPVPAGSLVTVRGMIVPLAVSVRIGGSEVPVLTTRATGPGSAEVLVFVPRTVAPGPRDVLVRAAGLTSTPSGPLLVQAPAPDGPSVSAVYPGKVAAGGELWVVGADLDQIRSATGGLEVIECDRRACRLGTTNIESAPGVPFKAAVVDPRGAAIFDLELSDEAPLVPVITSLAPNPATRGAPLVIRGERLGQVRSVVIGGVAQSLDFVDVDRLEITVALGTPLGAERVFVAGNVGSLATMVTVLDPLPAEPGPEVSPESGPESGPDAPIEPGPESAQGEPAIEPRAPATDAGCATGGAESSLGLGLLALLVVRTRSRSRSRA